MKLKYDFAIQEVADNFVAVGRDRKTGDVAKVLKLNETGAVILQGLLDGADTVAIVSRLLEEYDVEPQEAEREVNAFLDMLTESELVQ